MQQINKIVDLLNFIQQGNNFTYIKKLIAPNTMIIKSVFHAQLIIEDESVFILFIKEIVEIQKLKGKYLTNSIIHIQSNLNYLFPIINLIKQEGTSNIVVYTLKLLLPVILILLQIK